MLTEQRIIELSIFIGTSKKSSPNPVFTEQKARTTYDNILRFCDDPDVIEPIKFLRAREVVHYQRFGEPKQTNYNFHCISILSENTKILLISNSTTLLLSSKERSFHFVITSLKTL